MSKHKKITLKSGWTDAYSYAASLEILVDLALRQAEQAGPDSGPLVRLIQSRDWVGLLDYELHYEHGQDVNHLICARQALGYFSKFEPLKLGGPSKTLVAFRKFVETEAVCQRVNERFCRYRSGTPMEYPWDAILVSAREKMGRILGKAPSLADMKFGFGPGATTNVQRKDACFRVKLGVQPACSSELLRFLPRFLEELPAYVAHHGERIRTLSDVLKETTSVLVDVVPGRLQFVPKDAKKFRTITVEPGLNTLFQQGIGKAIRKRLSKAGIDLSQQERNRDLARLGSRTNHLATVDFSSASDTIATQMVAFLLPDDWFVLLDLARTGTVEFNGLHIRLEKFSTMGNSYTFELESAIFYSLAWATLRFLKLPTSELSIYGDDLIIPSTAYSLAEAVFAFCGFTINAAKSFRDGPFRESCGADYYSGTDIRPYFQKKYVSAETLFTLHNHFMRTGNLSEAAYIREKWIHPDLIIFGPDGYGDGHLIGDWLANRMKRIRDTHGDKKFPCSSLGWDGSFFETYCHEAMVNTIPHSGDELLPVYSIYARDSSGVSNPLDPLPPSASIRDMWCDPKYLTVKGSASYKKVSVYTLHRGIFVP